MRTNNKQNMVIITTSWDDGHKLDLKLAQLLKKYNLKGTFYISPSNREWRKNDLLTDKEVNDLSSEFEIGSHTMTHKRLTKIGEKEVRSELVNSKIYLEKITKKKIISFCYPYGDFNNNIKKLVKDSGYSIARTVNRHSFILPADPYAAATSIHTYNQKSDIFKILFFTQFNLIEFIRCMDWEYLAKKMFDTIYKNGGVYHIWGHSKEIEDRNEWDKLERVLKYIGNKKNVIYIENNKLIK